MQVRAKKALGQHFLTDLSIARRIAATVESYRGLPVIEVGPGMGVLTQFLLAAGYDVTVIEIDQESVDYLKANYSQLEGRIICDDFLRLDLREIVGDREFVVIGNYPYNISSQIYFKVLDYKDQVVCCSGMLQREVAQRLTSGPGSKSYGILSVLLQAWYRGEYLFTVDEDVFSPPPKVKSGVVRFTRNEVTRLDCDERLMRTVVKTSFGQRRKQLRNSLKPLLPKGSASLGLPIMDKRPEQLSVGEFVELTRIVTSSRGAE